MTDTDRSDRQEQEQEQDGPSFKELVENATAGNAHDSRDSAMQYVAIDLLDAGVEEQEEHLSDLQETVEKVAGHAFRDAVMVAARNGETAAANWLITEILKEVDEETAVGARFAERLRQKEGHIAQSLDSALTQAKAAAETELEEIVIEWGEVV